MSTKEKNEIISQIFMLLSKLVECDTADVPPESAVQVQKTELVKGLTSNTIRKMIARGELECVRAGCGTNGKILIPKANIVSLCTKQQRGQ